MLLKKLFFIFLLSLVPNIALANQCNDLFAQDSLFQRAISFVPFTSSFRSDYVPLFKQLFGDVDFLAYPFDWEDTRSKDLFINAGIGMNLVGDTLTFNLSNKNEIIQRIEPAVPIKLVKTEPTKIEYDDVALLYVDGIKISFEFGDQVLSYYYGEPPTDLYGPTSYFTIRQKGDIYEVKFMRGESPPKGTFDI